MADQIRIRELSLWEDRLHLRLEGVLESCGQESREEAGAQRIQLLLKTAKDERLLPLLVLYTFGDGETIRFGAEGTYHMKYVFRSPMRPGEEAALAIIRSETGEALPWSTSLEAQTGDSRYELLLSDGECRIRRVVGDRRAEGEYSPMPLWLRVGRGFLFVFFLLLIPLWLLEGLAADRGYLPFVYEDVGRYQSKRSRILRNMNERLLSLTGHKLSPTAVKTMVFRREYRAGLRKRDHGGEPVLLFLSIRGSALSGNMQCVYEACSRERGWRCVPMPLGREIKSMGLAQIRRIARACGGAALILLDDRTSFIDEGRLLPETKVLQLWHACGAFKTFGFSRLGRDRTVREDAANHRRYDQAIVSSKNIVNCYAEGFGIPRDHVTATGIPRTDWLMDEKARRQAADRVYARYPQLRGKRVLLFAPTFRGNGKVEAYYPMERLDVAAFVRQMGEDEILLIKHHPFVRQRHPIPESCRERVFDLYEYGEFNELLCVTDLLITDYSSAVFEAALLEIPMVFYAFDLVQYTATRDFYSLYRSFVPGPVAQDQNRLQELIASKEPGGERVRRFAARYFDHPGSATAETVKLIKKIILK